MKLALALMLVSASLLPAFADAEGFDGDTRVWNELLVQQWRDGDLRTYTWAEVRWVDDARRFGTWLVQQKLYYQRAPDLQFGLGAAWIAVRPDGGGSHHIGRIEFEANPSWRLGDRDDLQMRNRFEPRWRELDDWDTQFVSRHRLRWTRRAAWLPGMERIEFSEEIFLDWQRGRAFENRLNMGNLFFRTAPTSTLNLYLQMRSLRFDQGERWQHALVFGLGYRWYPR